jgi:nucleoid-associated protein YgaU
MGIRSPFGGRAGRGLALLVTFAAAGSSVLAAAGDPSAQVAAILGAGSPAADPVEVVLASLALLAEALSAYLLLLTVLGITSALPGLPGRSAAAGLRILAAPSVRRGLGAALGGVLLAHVAFGSGIPAVAATGAPGRPPSSAPAPAATPPSVVAAAVRSATLGAVLGRPRAPSPPSGPAGTPSGAPSDPLPGPSPDRAIHVVVRGDTLWDIAERNLPRGARTASRTAEYWPLLHAENRRVIGADPDRLLPGMRLAIPAAPGTMRGDAGGAGREDW